MQYHALCVLFIIDIKYHVTAACIPHVSGDVSGLVGVIDGRGHRQCLRFVLFAITGGKSVR